MTTVDARIADTMLACPACHADVATDADGNWIICSGCGRRYPVVDGIPVMIASRAAPE